MPSQDRHIHHLDNILPTHRESSWIARVLIITMRDHVLMPFLNGFFWGIGSHILRAARGGTTAARIANEKGKAIEGIKTWMRGIFNFQAVNRIKS
ncbi:uncharacterized protein VTP21DRAFT_1295 [Calcarisporiella thermophila]|uniref:uncharacterized protein n=1 Tax=Calcarisporiella thermophila TaxID=911321 RepID=UPI00374306D9